MDTFIDEFSSFEVETSPTPSTPTPEELAARNDQLFRRAATSHKPIDPSFWAVKILETLNLAPGNHIVRVTKFNTPRGLTFFLFSDETEIVTSKAIQDASRETFFISQLDEGDCKVVTLFDVVHYSLTTTGLCCVLRSNVFKRFLYESPILVVQYTTDSTVRMPSSNLFDILSRQHSVLPANTGELSARDLTPLPSISHISSVEDIMPFLVSVSRRLEETEDVLLSVIQAYQRSTRMLDASMDRVRRERLRRIEGDDVVRDRVGHLHEQVMRNAISLTYGPDWGIEVVIGGFTDAFSFVSHGLGKSPLQQQDARARLTKKFCKGLNKFHITIPDYQTMFANDTKYKLLRIEQEKLEERYYKVGNPLYL